MQGQDQQDVDKIGQGDAEAANLTERERALLDYVKVLTLEPAKVTDAHVERLRKSGWNDEQIFEASFITALFAFYNRMADAYGLDYNPQRWLPPDQRPPDYKLPERRPERGAEPAPK
ncbi:MAG: carboxymuconolactone decarboxylase family protein [Armatimonadota bacterium]